MNFYLYFNCWALPGLIVLCGETGEILVADGYSDFAHKGNLDKLYDWWIEGLQSTINDGDYVNEGWSQNFWNSYL